MTSVTYQYVYYAFGPHLRQPMHTGGGGFVTISTLPGGTYSPGDTFAASQQPGTQTVGTATLPFSFMTVSGGSTSLGGAPVGLASVDPKSPPPPVFVGAAPINVVVVYVEPGGVGSGATIDEFDLTTGQLLSDTFVKVAPDETGALTKSGNVDGFVDTTNSAETISALPTTSPSGVDFVGWMTLGPPAKLSSSADLVVGKGQSQLALAFYQSPPANLGTITGTIQEDTDGGMFTLGGATISALPGGSTKSNPDGTYVLTNLKPGPVKLTASHVLTTTESEQITVVAGQTVTADFVLVRIGTKF